MRRILYVLLFIATLIYLLHREDYTYTLHLKLQTSNSSFIFPPQIGEYIERDIHYFPVRHRQWWPVNIIFNGRQKVVHIDINPLLDHGTYPLFTEDEMNYTLVIFLLEGKLYIEITR